MAESSPISIVVRTYASYTAIGFAIVRIVNGEEELVNTGYKLLTHAQRNVSTFKRELAALKFALDSNATLLTENDYIVEADYLPLRSLLSFSD